MAASVQQRDDVQPVANETLDRFLTGAITVIPLLALGLVAWQLWHKLLGWSDLDRLRDHVRDHRAGRSPSASTGCSPTARSRPARPCGPCSPCWARPRSRGRSSRWVADHRKHHAFSDQPGDPHSPHVDHGVGSSGALRGLLARARRLAVHPHPARAAKTRYAPDLIADPVVSYVDRTFLVWVIGGLVARVRAGLAIGGTLRGRRSPACCGAARCGCSCCTTSTYCINSLCHFFGRQRFETGDESRNLAWLSLLSVRRGVAQQPPRVPDVRRATGCALVEVDTSACVIWGLEQVGLAWDVVRIDHRNARQTKLRPRPAGVTAEPLRCAARSPDALPERPFRVELWDGTSARADQRPAGRRSACARPRRSGTCCVRPASSALGRAYVSGRDRGRRHRRGARAAGRPGARRRSTRGPRPTSRSPRSAPARCGTCPQVPETELRPEGPPALDPCATGARSPTTTTCPTSSSRCSSTSR